MRSIVVVAAIAVASSVFGQPLVPLCGTTDQRIREAEDRAVTIQARQKLAMGKKAQVNASVRDSIVVLTADDTTAPYRRPFDLEGRTLIFRRMDAEKYSRENVDLQSDDMTGAEAKYPVNGAASYTLPFAFPFFDTTLTQVSLTQFNAITVGTPIVPGEQINDAELAATKSPVIAPLWMTAAVVSGSNIPTIQAKTFSDHVTVSWSVDRTALSYDVQASLFSNGDIRFSYKRAKTVPIASVLITSGNENWRRDEQLLVAQDDALGDVAIPASATLKPLLDINAFSVTRIANSNLIEFRMKVSGQRSQLASSETAVYYVYVGDSALRQYVAFSMSGGGSSNDSYVLPVWGSLPKSPAARMEGDTVVMDVLQDYLVGPLDNVSIRAYTTSSTSSQWADWVNVTANLTPPAQTVQTDFRTRGAEASTRPIQEAFTLAVLNVGGVWSEIKDAYKLDDGMYDGVAIYQNFLTDIVLYAGAYSTGGNPAASGVKLGSTSTPQSARTPALLHMNAINYGWNATTDNSAHVVMHEFAHRWLYSIGIVENGATTRVLNPASSHPAQYVHTPAAFRVVSSTDASVMGGSTWTDNNNGTFTSPPFSNYSYSWLDLYLMGLADKSEVPPWFYISDSSPKLGDSYYPPNAQVFSGKRKDVVMQQMLDSMGERKPAWPDTQRHFNVLFVVVATPDRDVTPEEIDSVQSYRRLLEQRFPVATAGRGSVSTTFTPALPGAARRRAAH